MHPMIRPNRLTVPVGLSQDSSLYPIGEPFHKNSDFEPASKVYCDHETIDLLESPGKPVPCPGLNVVTLKDGTRVVETDYGPVPVEEATCCTVDGETPTSQSVRGGRNDGGGSASTTRGAKRGNESLTTDRVPGRRKGRARSYVRQDDASLTQTGRHGTEGSRTRTTGSKRIREV